ncbi:hypothetical protein WH50_06485 [Pokkaliibacter plantistimulans]|uniref:Type I restriction modification DNA specificity domain-containing protein n=1 Tax=Pokkaliibacter plantistimulans TaxID=1635171 RepID=A0ABX5M0M4_9GAMM|nr:hypothetical protein WH50_06485 [Pokkaliibacter plantistimulans]
MFLSDVATVEVGLENADFYIVRRGTMDSVGSVTKEFNPEHIGVSVFRTDILLPTYLYYCFMHIHSQGHWRALATGTLSLVNIRLREVRSIRLQMQH